MLKTIGEYERDRLRRRGKVLIVCIILAALAIGTGLYLTIGGF